MTFWHKFIPSLPLIVWMILITHAIAILSGGALLQALTGLAVLLAFYFIGIA